MKKRKKNRKRVYLVTGIGAAVIAKKTLKVILCIMACILSVVIAFAVSIRYVTEWKLTDVGTEVSADGCYYVLFQEKGEPDWPFGSSHARVTIYEGDNVVRTFDVDIADDGGRFRESNYSVDWIADGVAITFHGSEQADEVMEIPLLP